MKERDPISFKSLALPWVLPVSACVTTALLKDSMSIPMLLFAAIISSTVGPDIHVHRYPFSHSSSFYGDFG